MSRPHDTAGQRSGIGVDAFGGQVVDPTENVKALTEAAHVRQDDLRNLNDRRIDAGLAHLQFVAELRAAHAREIRDLESKRLDAIRQVDVTAVKTEADRALAAIQALAATTQTNAENLRTALQSTAQTIAKQTSDTVQQITERLAALEKASYTGEGKQARDDPAMQDLALAVKALAKTRDEGAGSKAGALDLRTTIMILLTAAAIIWGFTK